MVLPVLAQQCSKRIVAKANLTKLQETLDEIDKLTKNQITLYLKRVQDIFEEGTAIHENIAVLIKEESELEPHQEEYELFTTMYEKIELRLMDARDKLPEPEVTTGDAAPIKTKLPPVQIPSFAGLLSDWVAFHDQFTALIHRSKVLTGAQKLNYLKNALKGDAAKLLQHIPATDGNYPEAWSILTERYQNKRDLVAAHLNRLLAQPKLTMENPTLLTQLYDTTNECIRTLKVLEQKVEGLDLVLLAHIMFGKLDPDSRRELELARNSSEILTYTELMEFLKRRSRALAAVYSDKGSGTKPKPKLTNDRNLIHTHHGSTAITCELCLADHKNRECPMLLSATQAERTEVIKKHLLCHNCLRKGHFAAKCLSQYGCRLCSKRPNTILHPATPVSSQPTIDSVATMHSNGGNEIRQVLLATAVIKVLDSHGKWQFCRALLDPGSQASFISEGCVTRLKLQRKATSVDITGIAETPIGKAHGVVELKCISLMKPNEQFTVNPLVLTKVTGKLPAYKCKADWPHLKNIPLADPHFYRPGQADIVLGAEIAFHLISNGRLQGEPESPLAVESKLGWLVTGTCGNNQDPIRNIKVFNSEVAVDEMLQKFWTLEEVPESNHYTEEETACEAHYVKHHARDEHGRYCVSLPFRVNVPQLGDSFRTAEHRFKQVERKLVKDGKIYQQYREFMQEYIELGHMTLITSSNCSDAECYYLPHHAVLKEDSKTTKLRVVFDASAKSKSGISLNDRLMVGPKIQDDLTVILLRFRSHPIAFTADIEKMYRQVRVSNPDTEFQRVLWRDQPELPLRRYRSNVITYGTGSASFAATRTVKQLAIDEFNVFPEAAKVAKRDVYMDDLFSGSLTTEKGLELRKQLNALFKSGGFNMRKWASNDPAVLEGLPDELRESKSSLSMENDESVKALGLQWQPQSDTFRYTVQCSPIPVLLTKRSILAETAKVFDPLGWVSPVVISAKILLQELWKSELGWDEPVLRSTYEKWCAFYEELYYIKSIRMKRCLVPTGATQLELHGFADASEKAYAAVVYLRHVAPDSTAQMRLVIAKTKVAPIKTVSLPRLELCGALLLAKLITFVQTSLLIAETKVYVWTDSTIVLNWIAAPSGTWKTFVANRVAKVQELISSEHWCHIRGTDNPADCATRGLSPKQLLDHPLWWQGPSFLNQNENWTCPSQVVIPVTDDTQMERRNLITVHHSHQTSSRFETVSSFVHLQRYIGYWLRFIKNRITDRQNLSSGPLSVTELNNSLTAIIRIVQREAFSTELHTLHSQLPLSTKSKLCPLNPFLDTSDVMRVGGRLRNSQLAIDQQQPMLLPRNHHITVLLIRHYHLKYLHAGPQLLQAHLQRKFWVICARDTIRRTVKNCIVCLKQKPVLASQLMGDLPAARVIANRPFIKCGVDYAGPFIIREFKERKPSTFKVYISLFVCMVTKAIHLELVSGLSTNQFLDALIRFTSRRGMCTDMHSDCGTNFVGADRDLKDWLKFTSSVEQSTKLVNTLAAQGINWHFNPPSAPHFGGLWEAGVKSMKFHLRRVLGSALLNYEEFNTMLHRIEACLNSRPLCPLSSDPNDLEALTPGHFLIGSALTSIPEPSYIDVKHLDRWQYRQQLLQHFWNRWNSEYLVRLQQRPKWMSCEKNLKVDDLVLIRDAKLGPQEWKLGRILEVYPGSDGLVRSVKLKTSDGEYVRPIVKLARLPYVTEYK